MPGVLECSRCGLPWVQNPITLEWTCFEHGRPDGSDHEKKMWEKSRGNKMSEHNTAAVDAAVNVLSDRAEMEFGIHISREFLRSTFVAGLDAYNAANAPVQDAPPLESTEDTSTVVTVTEDGSTVVVPVADVESSEASQK